MNAEPDRSRLWRELREALSASKVAPTVEARDALLERAGEWAQKLAETAAPDSPEPPEQTYFLEAALTESSNEDWAIPL